MPAARFLVAGKVQGVFFRASAREEALQLGLTGHARNRADGSVEVLAQGEPGALAELERWLRHGPPLARVESLTREDLAEQPLHGFGIG
ncbi:acylphosphatase [Rhodanobacter sp. PCA2]|uniref:acylphosphatase n=1 Tax=Rhodanobacter sp. PCA2 TaxID=2006117 RepID=UPI0015E77B59|nr:acylphosphatase [Rhodanobacter sp. PCA2]MBA2077519.1 acylphosphatase [Rhodanobacter sp. PCA2]